MRIRLILSDFVAEKICNPQGAVGQAPAADECSPDSPSEKLRDAKKKLSEFNTVYRNYRVVLFRQNIRNNLQAIWFFTTRHYIIHSYCCVNWNDH